MYDCQETVFSSLQDMETYRERERELFSYIPCRAVHRTQMKIDPPSKYPTPYGGRLEWTLPGQNKLIVHLKDKAKIRHKKRWSQVGDYR